MPIHLTRDLENLQRRVLSLASAVEQTIDKAIRALFDRDIRLADALLESDAAIDMEENEIEEDCLKILALHQPVAVDLRRVTAILKINSDLERMADLAVNIAERAGDLARGPEIGVPIAFRRMTDLTNTMVRGNHRTSQSPHASITQQRRSGPASVFRGAAAGTDRRSRHQHRRRRRVPDRR
jgi:phosphate transport system protein